MVKTGEQPVNHDLEKRHHFAKGFASLCPSRKIRDRIQDKDPELVNHPLIKIPKQDGHNIKTIDIYERT